MCDALAVAHPRESASSYLSSQSLAASRCNLNATSRSSHSRRSLPCHFFLCRVALFCLVLSLFAVSRRFSLQPSCHLAAVPLSSFSPLSLPPLSLRSLLPRPAAPPPAGPLFSRLLSPFGATPSSSLRILAPQVHLENLESESTRFSFASRELCSRALSARLRLTMIALLAAPSTLGAPAHRSPRSLARSPARLFLALPHLSCLFSGLVISTPLPLSRRCELRLPAMCDAGEDAPAAEEEPPAASVLDDLSGVPAEVLDPRSGTRALVLHLALERTRIQL